MRIIVRSTGLQWVLFQQKSSILGMNPNCCMLDETRLTHVGGKAAHHYINSAIQLPLVNPAQALIL